MFTTLLLVALLPDLVPTAQAGDRIATIHVGGGLPDGFTGGVSLTALRPLELEVGAGTTGIYDTRFIRGGLALPIVNTRGSEGRGAVLEALGMAGYRYLREENSTGDFDRHGVEFDVALELSGWLAPHLGLDVQALAGIGPWVGTQDDGVGIFTDGRLTVGVAF